MESPMTLGQARVVDPVLTNVARGYRNMGHVWMYLFPVVPVMQRAGRIVKFGAEDFSELSIGRSPGSNRKQIHYGHLSDPYSLDQRALDGKVPIEIMEESMAVPGISYSTVAVRKTMAVVSLQIEIAAAKLATTASNYEAANKTTVNAADRWETDGTSPAKQVETAKESVAVGIGMEPNTLIVGVEVHRGLLNNEDVIDRVKHTEGLSGSSTPVITNEKLAQYFGVENYGVGRARKGKPGAFTPIWGKVAVLAFTEVGSMADMGSPSYGYTYRLQGYPVAQPGWYDRSCESWLYPVTTEDTPVIAGAVGGHLFTTVVG